MCRSRELTITSGTKYLAVIGRYLQFTSKECILVPQGADLRALTRFLRNTDNTFLLNELSISSFVSGFRLTRRQTTQQLDKGLALDGCTISLNTRHCLQIPSSLAATSLR